MSTYCGMIVSKIEKDLKSVTEVNLRKDNDDIQKFSPSTPVCDKTVQTPSFPTQSLPSNQENSISQIEDKHHYLNKKIKQVSYIKKLHLFRKPTKH